MIPHHALVYLQRPLRNPNYINDTDGVPQLTVFHPEVVAGLQKETTYPHVRQLQMVLLSAKLLC